MNIELCFFDGCPSYAHALENLREALRMEGVSGTVDMVKVESEGEARTKRLIGSPTIRINGVDLEGVEADARGYALGCRTYRDGQRSAGYPSVTAIRRALRQFGNER